MARLVFVTQQIDPSHPSLGVAVPKIRALSKRLDEVVVLTTRAVEGVLPENCRIRIFAAGSQFGRGLRYAAVLNQELSPRPMAVLAHMVPFYAILAAPLTRPRHVPLLLWFTHWRITRRLRLAERAATTVLTVDRRSFPLDSPKVVPIGHGIDMETFRCVVREPAGRLRVLALGRTSPSKGLETIIRAVVLAGAELERLPLRRSASQWR
jgi:glycosyltransferase involved in cell wall biosynthesis